MADRFVFWLGSSLEDLRAFPSDARRAAGFQLRRIQQGLDPNDWKAVLSAGQGVREIQIHTRREHRVFYVTKLTDGIYVLHAFEKRTRKTSRHDLDLARERFRALLATRQADNPTRR